MVTGQYTCQVTGNEKHADIRMDEAPAVVLAGQGVSETARRQGAVAEAGSRIRARKERQLEVRTGPAGRGLDRVLAVLRRLGYRIFGISETGREVCFVLES
jgi:hypothetical protein